MRLGNLLNEIPLWEVVDGTVLNAHGVAEVGVRLHLPPSLTQTGAAVDLWWSKFALR